MAEGRGQEPDIPDEALAAADAERDGLLVLHPEVGPCC